MEKIKIQRIFVTERKKPPTMTKQELVDLGRLVNTIEVHNVSKRFNIFALNNDGFYQQKWRMYIDKFTKKENHIIIAISLLS
ncbi:hypothetical protein P9B03_12460 [Metasolibacillus meyeri]|uniref:Uncharacterized protein n=1 Tax=Metasolibacillus meyeri TaxID=1071052 RepID=A0AAW9NS46_9BACL|nr:hypothetical protein [Metasolibacillus meyeri]MEC1179301.1 hypothetical protein [Metasolibacillus meyeri]